MNQNSSLIYSLIGLINTFAIGFLGMVFAVDWDGTPEWIIWMIIGVIGFITIGVNTLLIWKVLKAKSVPPNDTTTPKITETQTELEELKEGKDV